MAKIYYDLNQSEHSISSCIFMFLFWIRKLLVCFLNILKWFLIPFSTDSVELVDPNYGEFTELEEVKSYEKPEDSTNICYKGREGEGIFLPC